MANVNASVLAASDITTRFRPPGATTMASMSLAIVWVRSWNVTVTLVTVPVIPGQRWSTGTGRLGRLWGDILDRRDGDRVVVAERRRPVGDGADRKHRAAIPRPSSKAKMVGSNGDGRGRGR